MQLPPSPEPGDFFDATSEPAPSLGEQSPDRCHRFLGIQFRCCRTYGRIYRDRDATAYQGNCPRCGSRVRVPIGPGGQGSRFFSAG